MAHSMVGSGTEEEPYQVTSVEELQDISQDLSAYYELVCDIEARHTKEWNDEKGFKPIGDPLIPFDGRFDGNNYKINNLHINRPRENSIGMFSLNNGQIRDVRLKSGTIEGNNHTGGIAGRNWGEVRLSYVRQDVSGSSFVGGLVGYNNGKIGSTHTRGDVLGNDYIGSLIGYNTGEVSSSYSVGDVSGDSWACGLIGSIEKEGEINGSFAFPNLGEPDDSTYSDLVVSRNNWEISYIIDTNTLYLKIDNEKYFRRKVSSVQAQNLAQGFAEYIVEVSNDFKTSVVVDK